ncbi:MAG: hypothetical protein HZC44_14320 [Geobacter sp.]|nr:hypothetical protein [Geobacter sp.]
MKQQASQNVAELSAPRLERIRSLRVVFGHQSVGKNIIDGLQTLALEKPAYRLNVVETSTPEKIAGPVFAHFRVGANMTPDSKIESFSQYVSRAGSAVDVAFFKFCYVDVGAETDADELFRKYQKTMADLKRQYPQLTFVHVTIPVKTVDGGVKGIAKRLLGKSTGEEANIKRARYNDLLRNEYLGKEPIFDLARFESTAPDGSRVEVEKNGARYEALHSVYSDDGEHLNREGGRRAALALLQMLADASEQLPNK